MRILPLFCTLSFTRNTCKGTFCEIRYLPPLKVTNYAGIFIILLIEDIFLSGKNECNKSDITRRESGSPIFTEMFTGSFLPHPPCDLFAFVKFNFVRREIVIIDCKSLSARFAADSSIESGSQPVIVSPAAPRRAEPTAPLKGSGDGGAYYGAPYDSPPRESNDPIHRTERVTDALGDAAMLSRLWPE